MKINLTEKYVLTTDSQNFILNKKCIVQSGKNIGKETLAQTGFYPSLEALLWGFLKEKQLQSSARTLEGLVRESSELLGYFRKIIKPYIGETAKDLVEETK